MEKDVLRFSFFLPLLHFLKLQKNKKKKKKKNGRSNFEHKNFGKKYI